jgi:arylsulfatase A-like enzyme
MSATDFGMTVDEVRGYIRVPATAVADEDLSRMMETAAADVVARCAWAGMDDPNPAPAPDPLVQSYLRRIQREVSARNLPLGLVGLDSGEYGPQRLPAWDALIEEHERAYRRQVLA